MQRGAGPCGPLTRLCADEGRWQAIAPRVDDAVAVDLDADGEEEYVVVDRQGEQLAVAYPDGARSSVFLTAQGPTAIAALPGEVVVALSAPPGLAVFGLDESGQLTRRRDIALSDPATALAASDLDADGAPELVAAMPDAHAIAVIDVAAATLRKYAAGTNPALFDVGDIDGDEHLDVVVLDAPSGLQVLRGTGDGRLREAVAESAGSELQVGGIDLADHDGDGDLDAFTHAGQDRVLVHRNDGDGRFSTPIALPLPAPLEGRGLAVGPVADSGFVGVSVPSSGGFDVWFGKGSVWLGRLGRALESAGTWIGASADAGMLVGGLGFLYRFAYRAAGSALEVWRSEDIQGDIFATSVTTGHLDDDVLLDVAVFDDGRLTLLRGRADRGLEPIASLELELDLASWPVTLAIADVTGDGRPDVLISDITRAWLVQATADGGYALRSPYMHKGWASQLVPVRTGPNEPAAVLVIPTSESGQTGGRGCSLLRFSEDGAVTEAIELLGSELVFGGAAVDFDEDGIDELLLAYHGSSTTFLAHMSPEIDTYVADATHDLVALTGGSVGAIREFAFAVGDLDGDGSVEAVVASVKAVVAVSGLAEGTPVVTITLTSRSRDTSATSTATVIWMLRPR
ncbi:FG-GAP repeat domain-containing protein [Nannocystis pusilla]|uniref:FG-GAP repeat domain-containing protein n=1 Tax=Nannocystis pusilla TaxID=889268 RepID=UPI003B7B24B9